MLTVEMNWFQAIILGIVQGLTEFLPVSSSGHLRIVPAFFGWEDPGTAFTAVTQLGTIAAVLIYFRRDLYRILTVWTRSLWTPSLRKELDAKLGWFIGLGTIPLGVFGLLFNDFIEKSARDLRLIGCTLILLGILLQVAEMFGKQRKMVAELTLKDGLIIGFAQAMAAIPGVSRSGATITAGLFLGFTREAAARYSFLLSVPAVVLSGIYKLEDITAGDGPTLTATVIATILAFVSGYAAIAWMLKYVSSHSMRGFVVYRILLGLMVLTLVGAGLIEPL